jgi:hypothetical protein
VQAGDDRCERAIACVQCDRVLRLRNQQTHLQEELNDLPAIYPHGTLLNQTSNVSWRDRHVLGPNGFARNHWFNFGIHAAHVPPDRSCQQRRAFGQADVSDLSERGTTLEFSHVEACSNLGLELPPSRPGSDSPVDDHRPDRTCRR